MTSQEIREQREAKGWSQSQLAREAGLAPSTVSEIERGRPAGPRSRRAIERAFGIMPAAPPPAPDGARLIEMEDGAAVAVDAADFERFGHLAWHRLKGQAARHERQDGQRHYRFLHRLILDVTDPMTEVWFRDRNPLNCRRSNLAIADRPSRYAEKRRRQKDYRLMRQLNATWEL